MVTDLPNTAEYISNQPFASQFFVGSAAPVFVQFGGASHVGRVRTNNEDHFAVIRRSRSQEVLLSNLPEGSLSPAADAAYCFIVADGLGGAAAGEWASRLALQKAWDLAGDASSWIMKFHDLSAQQVRERTEAFATEMHNSLREYGRADPELSGMATTWTSAYIVAWDALIAHVGDSRAYLFRRGELRQITRDQTLAQELIDSGVPPEQTRRVRHILTNTVGGNAETVSPDVAHLILEKSDRVLLCTDGLTELVSDREIAEVVGRPIRPQAACDTLIQLALDHGGKDNVTVVLVEFTDQPLEAATK
jgi:serine/threonine protein phosphatase PrpC